jgi:sugar/nucleoside kinase (ribokinase family)
MEFIAARPGGEPTMVELMELGQRTAERNHRPVLITLGREGVLICSAGRAQKVPAYPAEDEGEIDPVGAGDATLASIAAVLAAGAGLDEAAVFAMVVASITVQQLGRCGTASPDAVRERFRLYAERYPDVVGA